MPKCIQLQSNIYTARGDPNESCTDYSLLFGLWDQIGSQPRAPYHIMSAGYVQVGEMKNHALFQGEIITTQQKYIDEV